MNSSMFGLAVKNNNVETVELIISIWFLSVKSKDIAQYKKFTRQGIKLKLTP